MATIRAIEANSGSEAVFVKNCTSYLAHVVKKAIKTRGCCVIGLSGGSTPKPILAKLATEYQSEIDWSKVSVFLVDDRYIASDHQDSNQCLLRDSLLGLLGDKAGLPQVVVPNTSLPIDECVADYGNRLSALVASCGGVIDLLTLGMGDDGHIASLFPPIVERGIARPHSVSCGVLHTTTDKFAVHDRISLDLPFILEAQEHVLFLKGKKQVYESMHEQVCRTIAGHKDVITIAGRWPFAPLMTRESTAIFIL